MTEPVVNIRAIWGGREWLAYSGYLSAAAERCNLPDEVMLSRAMNRMDVVQPKDSTWLGVKRYWAELRDE